MSARAPLPAAPAARDRNDDQQSRTETPSPAQAGPKQATPLEAQQSAETADAASDEDELVELWNNDAQAGPEWSGPRGYEPTRYGDWAKNGRVSDF